MYFHPSDLVVLAPTGDPSPEALHREEYMTRKAPVAPAVATPDHRAKSRARHLRAQVAARVGQFF